jgi:hypothetical protein
MAGGGENRPKTGFFSCRVEMRWVARADCSPVDPWPAVTALQERRGALSRAARSRLRLSAATTIPGIARRDGCVPRVGRSTDREAPRARTRCPSCHGWHGGVWADPRRSTPVSAWTRTPRPSEGIRPSMTWYVD